jgi:hypothetical protein
MSSLERELYRVLEAARLDRKQAAVVATRLGWDGAGTTTLAAAGEPARYSRERVRQLEVRLRRHAVTAPTVYPTTVNALRLLEGWAPIASEDAARRLSARGVSERPFAPSGLIAAAEVLGLEHGLEESDGVVLEDGQGELAGRIAEEARRIFVRDGIGTVHAVTRTFGGALSAARIRSMLACRTEVSWLDAGCEYFIVTSVPRSRAVTVLRKMLALSPSLRLADIADGIRRALRTTLPLEAIAALCESQSWLAVENGIVSATSPVDERVLSPGERKVVEMFRVEGPTMRFSDAVQLAERNDLTPASMRFHLVRTPVLRAVARGTYALVGPSGLR